MIWVWDGRRLQARVGPELASLLDADAPSSEISPVLKSAVQPEGLTVRVVEDGRAVPCECVRFYPEGTSDPATLTISHEDVVFTATLDEATGRALLSAGSPAR